ncbi:MAG TPA: peptidase M48 [Candidatus Omnitrophica bacterium]|nr:MAG: peptidase M48 [Omnitrophica WOR_2 bacterium GWC2_45_7]HBR14001.1 peptidase M48 [Candidatus Omnitrophota bacterium]
MNIYLIVILVILIGHFCLELMIEMLNLQAISTKVPEEFEDTYDPEKYRKSQDYLKATTKFHLIREGFTLTLTTAFIVLGGFNVIDRLARGIAQGEIVTGLIFAGVLMGVSLLTTIPFSYYSTFVIEEKFGFNKTSQKTFILDILKSVLLSVVLGGILYALIIWFFEKAGALAWIYAWGAVTLFQLFITFLAPVMILPLFNKFIPLEDSVLKQAIENYAKTQRFQIQGIFKMDGSRRSTKTNAFFTGFGKYRRIALFDTLIERHTIDELVSVLAHEIGHCQLRHVTKMVVWSIINAGLMFFLMGFFIDNAGLFSAFRMEETSIYASLFFFGFLYTPVSLVLSVITNNISRHHEYQADQFAVRTYQKPEAMIMALKKLSVDNLSNLTPHPLKVFFDYSHPTVLKRIERMREFHGS